MQTLYEIFEKVYNKKEHLIFNVFGIKMKFRCPQIWINNYAKRNGNRFIVHKKDGTTCEFSSLKGYKVFFEDCTNCTFEIWEPYSLYTWQNSITFLGSNHLVQIKRSRMDIKNLKIVISGKNNKVLIDEDFSLTNGAYIQFAKEENCCVSIGKDCMFASNIIIISATDWHAIYDINDEKKIVNLNTDGITIGDHVWVATDVKIMKNTCIADNTVVATGSIVTKKFQKQNTIIGGIPAKVIKEGVNWSRMRINEYMKNIVNNNE